MRGPTNKEWEDTLCLSVEEAIVESHMHGPFDASSMIINAFFSWPPPASIDIADAVAKLIEEAVRQFRTGQHRSSMWTNESGGWSRWTNKRVRDAVAHLTSPGFASHISAKIKELGREETSPAI